MSCRRPAPCSGSWSARWPSPDRCWLIWSAAFSTQALPASPTPTTWTRYRLLSPGAGWGAQEYWLGNILSLMLGLHCISKAWRGYWFWRDGSCMPLVLEFFMGFCLAAQGHDRIWLLHVSEQMGGRSHFGASCRRARKKVSTGSFSLEAN